MKKYVYGALVAAAVSILTISVWPRPADAEASGGAVTQATRPWTVSAAAYSAGITTESLVSASVATTVPSSALIGRRAVEIQNLGPNAIYCALGGTAPVVSKTRAIAASGGVWAIDLGAGVIVKCLAATADQVTGAATITTEVR